MTTKERRGTRAQQSARPSLATVKLVDGATTYTFQIDGEVQRIQFQDAPPVSPVTGEQNVKSRPYHPIVSFKRIKNAFAHEIELHFERHAGVIDHMSDCRLDTRHPSGIWMPMAENNPAFEAGTGDLDVAGDGAGNANRATKAAVFFDGTTNTGVFTWEHGDSAVRVQFWNGTSWAVTSGSLQTASPGTTRHVAVHKGRLLFLRSNGTSGNAISSSTDGATFAVLSNYPGATVNKSPGSMLFDDGEVLWCFNQDSTTSGAIDAYKTSDVGATAWTTVFTSFTGKLRDVKHFYDRDGNSQIVVLTDTYLYWLDQTNDTLAPLLPLPFAGRGMVQIGNKLLVIMDAFKALLYSADGGVETEGISPNLVSPYDFGTDTTSMVSIEDGLLGPFVGFTGDTVSSGDATLVLQAMYTEGEFGWHYIWHEATNVQAGGLRFLALHPPTGDLMGAINSTSANADLSTGLQFKDAEIDPAVQSTLDRGTSATMASPRLDFGSPMVSTTIWDEFLHSIGLDANETVSVAMRINGSTGSYSTKGVSIADNTLITVGATSGAITAFADYSGTVTGAVQVTSGTHGLSTGMRVTISGTTSYNGTFTVTRINANTFYIIDTWVADDATGTFTTLEGVNCRDVQFQWTFSANAASDVMRLLSIDVGYNRVWPVRYMYVFDVVVSGQRGPNMPPPETVWTNLDTIAALATKALLSYGNVTNKSVFPMPESQARLILRALGNPLGNPITGTRRIALLEA